MRGHKGHLVCKVASISAEANKPRVLLPLQVTQVYHAQPTGLKEGPKVSRPHSVLAPLQQLPRKLQEPTSGTLVDCRVLTMHTY